MIADPIYRKPYPLPYRTTVADTYQRRDTIGDTLLIRNAGDAQSSAIFCRSKAIRSGGFNRPKDRRSMISISRGPHAATATAI